MGNGGWAPRRAGSRHYVKKEKCYAAEERGNEYRGWEKGLKGPEKR